MIVAIHLLEIWYVLSLVDILLLSTVSLVLWHRLRDRRRAECGRRLNLDWSLDMELLTSIHAQRQRLARYTRQARHNRTRRIRRTLFGLRAALKRLDKLAQAEIKAERKPACE